MSCHYDDYKMFLMEYQLANKNKINNHVLEGTFRDIFNGQCFVGFDIGEHITCVAGCAI